MFQILYQRKGKWTKYRPLNKINNNLLKILFIHLFIYSFIYLFI